MPRERSTSTAILKMDNITDDEEYEIVADRFDELLDEEEFDEMD